MNVGAFVDTSDLYHRIRRKFEGGKLCYESYFEKLASYGNLTQAYAYVMQSDNEASGFITCLKMIGFDVFAKRPRVMRICDRDIKRCDWGVNIAVDVSRTIDRLDQIILGVSNPDYVPLVQWIKDQGRQVVILASCIPKSLRNVADSDIEITEDFLEQDDDE